MNSSALSRIRKLVTNRDTFPEALGWIKNRHPGRVFHSQDIHEEEKQFDLDAEVALVTYWKALPQGSGLTLSVRILSEEILRIDCFDKGQGHLHAAYFLPPRGAGKRVNRNEIALMLPEHTIAEQIDRAIFEVAQNLSYHKARVANKRIRETQISQPALESALAKAKLQLLAFAENIDARDNSPSDRPGASSLA